MSDHEPLDPSLAKLFREEPALAPPQDAQARVLARLALAIPIGAPHAPFPRSAPTALGAKGMTAIAAAFVVGGLVGAAAVVALRPVPTAQIMYVDRPAPPASSAPDSPAPTSPVVPARAPSSLPEPRTAPSIAPDGLTAERDLIEGARSQLTNGDAAGALAQLQDHTRRYPHGQLTEEREALAVEALVQTGRYDAARARATQLRARWPNSVFLPAVDATLRSIP